MATPSTPLSLPITNERVLDLYEWLFAPWVKEMGLRDFDVSPGQRSRFSLRESWSHMRLLSLRSNK